MRTPGPVVAAAVALVNEAAGEDSQQGQEWPE